MMAKGKSHRSGTREPTDSLTLRVALPPQKARANRNLSLIEDFRKFDFEPATRPARLLSGAPARFSVGVGNPKRSGPGKFRKVNPSGPVRLSFTAPRDTIVCVRRSTRKEVLFAKNKTGKRGQRKPRRTPWSNYKC